MFPISGMAGGHLVNPRRFDPQVLADLTGVDEGQLGLLLDSYLGNQYKVRARLEVASGRGEAASTHRDPGSGPDVDGIERMAHRLKGAARSIGADALVSCCERLETAARSHSADIDELLTAALAEMDELERAIQAYLDAGPTRA